MNDRYSNLDDADHPYRRCGARMIDALFYVYVLMVPLLLSVAFLIAPFINADSGFFQRAQWKDWFLIYPLTLFLTMLANAFTIFAWDTTPGKWLFGIVVRDRDGSRLPFARALKREGRVLLSGMGLGIPIASFFLMIRSLYWVETKHIAPWDELLGTSIAARRPSGWQLAGIVFGTTLLVASRAYVIIPKYLM